MFPSYTESDFLIDDDLPVTPYFCDPSPHFFDGGVSCRSTPYLSPWDYTPKPKSRLWTCSFCKCANLPETTTCEHCNAPRYLNEQREKSSLYGMPSSSIKVEIIEAKENGFIVKAIISIKNYIQLLFRKAPK